MISFLPYGGLDKERITLNDISPVLVQDYLRKVGSSLVSSLVSEQGRMILRLCSKPRSRKEILESIGLSNHTYNFNKRIKPLIDEGLIAYTSQAANSPLQSYIITDKGIGLLNDDIKNQNGSPNK